MPRFNAISIDEAIKLHNFMTFEEYAFAVELAQRYAVRADDTHTVYAVCFFAGLVAGCRHERRRRACKNS